MPPEAIGLRLRIARKSVEAEGICSFDLVAAGADTLAVFEAGAHIELLTPSGHVRQYSLLNPSPSMAPACYRIGVLDDPASRGGSRSMHRHTAEGDVLSASLPRNHFALQAGAGRSLLLAGGIGITPILAMAEQLHAAGADFELRYAARNVDRMAFRSHIANSPWVGRASMHLDDGARAQRLDLASCLAHPQAADHVYACGPRGFLDAVQAQAAAAGWYRDHVHFEHFKNTADTGQAGAFEVQIASSGQLISVAPEQSIAQALAVCGIELPMSCEQGVCGTCVTAVLAGRPDHRDLYLTDAEHDAGRLITPCCSRALSSRLVLDL